MTRRQHEAECDLVVVGGGVAGLYAALCAANEADVVVLVEGPDQDVCQLPRAGRSRRRGRPGRRSCAARRGHDRGGPRPLPAERRLRPHRRGARAGRRPRRPGRRVRPEPRARRRTLARPRRPRRRRGDRTADRARARRARARPSADLGPSRASARRALVDATSRCVGVDTDERCDRGAGDAARDRRRGRALGADDESRAARSATASRWPTAREPAVADLEFIQFHPTALRGSGVLLSEALRGAGALLLDDERPSLHRRARAARRRRACDRSARHSAARPPPGRPGPLPVGDRSRSRMRGSTPPSSRSRSRLRPTTRWAASSPISTGAPSCPGSTRPASARARASTARTASRRTRCSSASSSAAGPRSPRSASPISPARHGQPPTPEPLEAVTPELRRALWQDAGLVRDAAGLERLRRAPHLLTRLIARERARPRGEPRRALPRRLPHEDPALRRPRRPPTRAGARAGAMVVAQELDLERIALAALAEDVGARRRDDRGHASPRTRPARRRLLLKEPGVVCGLPRGRSRLPRARSRTSRFERSSAADGDRSSSPTELARIAGRTRAVLTGERTALNLLGRLSGIATLTRRYVDAVEGTGATILDTRKTTPGLRALEKYAVRCGGGREPPLRPRRRDPRQGQPPARRGRRRGRRRAPARSRNGLPIEVEAETLDDVREALAAGAEQILLDNMSPALMREAVAARRRPRDARGLGRRHARHRARDRRDRRRLHLGRRADPFGALPRRLAGGLCVTTAEITTLQEEVRALARRARTP